MDNDLALIKAQIAELQSRVEGLTARGLDRLPAPVQIAEVNASGQFLDWNNTAYVADTTVPAITPHTPGGSLVIWRPQAQRWEYLAAATNVQWISFVTSSALTNQAVLDSCAVVLDWYGNTGGITQADITNEMGWQADAGVLGYASYRPADGKWILMLIPCPAGNS